MKTEVKCTKEELANIIKTSVHQLLQNTANIQYRYTSADEIKKSLNQDETLLHIDFSENYQCKYGKEIVSTSWRIKTTDHFAYFCVILL
ncbi:hypothetical protein PR048_007074 [Dryococelus australis]|uniref:Uncharacterized protein n=1 Tax=Dryococelus australis TaxID=614101 RepID=A0ABQ9ICQ9_9NEOP|nr:hypothetical protein PR048_007074 [Dryococelus australis]